MGGARAKGGASVINGQDCDRNSVEGEEKHWRPLLLMIPLRLGLTEINPVYAESLKVG